MQQVKPLTAEEIEGVKAEYRADPYDWDGAIVGSLLATIDAQAARIAELEAVVREVRDEVFYFMVQNVDQRGAKSYAKLGAIKEKLTTHLREKVGEDRGK